MGPSRRTLLPQPPPDKLHKLSLQNHEIFQPPQGLLNQRKFHFSTKDKTPLSNPRSFVVVVEKENPPKTTNIYQANPST